MPVNNPMLGVGLKIQLEISASCTFLKINLKTGRLEYGLPEDLF